MDKNLYLMISLLLFLFSFQSIYFFSASLCMHYESKKKKEKKETVLIAYF